jgi:hypothetical protein
MVRGTHRASSDLGSMEPGTHLCALEQDAARLDRVAATFVAQGLAAGDQVLYIASDRQVGELLRVLPDSPDARQAVGTGQLMTSPFGDAYGSSRPDDLATLAEGFRAAAGQARKRGFPGLRVAARMDPLGELLGSFGELLGSFAEVVAWERMAGGLQRELRVSSVCLYDAGALAPSRTGRARPWRSSTTPWRPISTYGRSPPSSRSTSPGGCGSPGRSTSPTATSCSGWSRHAPQ